MTIAKSAWTAVVAVLATLAVVLVMVFVPTNSAGAAGYTEWTNDGPVVTTHENVAPGTDTDTVRWLPVGEPTKHVTVEAVAASYTAWSNWAVVEDGLLSAPTPPANTDLVEYRVAGPVTVVDSEGTGDVTITRHFSWTGGPVEGTPPVPTSPQGDSNWQPNTRTEPNGHLHSTNAPDGGPYTGTGLHFASHGNSGKGDWFYFGSFVIQGEEPVSHQEWTLEQRTRTLIPAVAEVSHLDYKWQKQVRTVITDNPTTSTQTPETPVVTPETPTETPEVPEETPVGNPNPTPTPDKNPPVKNNPPKDTQVIECVDGVFVTTVNGEVISESGSCVERDENETPVTFNETGL